MTDFTLNLITVITLGLVLVGYIAYTIHLAIKNRVLSSIVLARSEKGNTRGRRNYYVNR